MQEPFVLICHTDCAINFSTVWVVIRTLHSFYKLAKNVTLWVFDRSPWSCVIKSQQYHPPGIPCSATCSNPSYVALERKVKPAEKYQGKSWPVTPVQGRGGQGSREAGVRLLPDQWVSLKLGTFRGFRRNLPSRFRPLIMHTVLYAED